MVTLYGDDAKRFLKEVAHPKYSKKKAKFLAKCEATYKRFKQPCPGCVEKDKQLKKANKRIEELEDNIFEMEEQIRNSGRS